ncbi:MAG: hypothetical protein KatS3mg103_0001 [Phycisphaerales bacterium]|nr:MAG: hypothetical protein KatS3mg103_0001 [Phycisphaerales bacterium]
MAQRSLIEARASTSSSTPTIHSRTTTFGSASPHRCRWWWYGAHRKIRLGTPERLVHL